LRRIIAVVSVLTVVSALSVLLGPGYVWPLFVFPLLLAAIFFFELGSLLVTFWLGNFFVLSHSLGPPPAPAALRQALLGMALFFVAGLLLGRFQHRSHESSESLAATCLHDRLTGLYTYGTFVDRLAAEIERSDRDGGDICVIMLDLDHFKRFNDTYGHEAGNDMLKEVGATLRSHVRGADVAARYGGEEFAVLVRGDEAQGFELAQRLRRAVETISVEVRDGRLVYMTVSAGVATYPAGASDKAQLVERSDDALYVSKRRGRNRVTVHTGVSAAEQESAVLTA
jgi:diguanylate cyclase (GGDEF)-like protein